MNMMNNISNNQLGKRIWLHGKQNSKSKKNEMQDTEAISLDMTQLALGTRIQTINLNQINNLQTILTLILVISKLLGILTSLKPQKL